MLFLRKNSHSLFPGQQLPSPRLVQAKRRQALEVCSSPKISHRSACRLVHRTSRIERSRPTQRSRPGSLLARLFRIPRSLHVACCNKSCKLFLLDRPHIRKRLKIMSRFGIIFEGVSDPNPTRLLVHQAQSPQQGSTPRQHQSAPCRKSAQTLCRDQTHKQALHR